MIRFESPLAFLLLFFLPFLLERTMREKFLARLGWAASRVPVFRSSLQSPAVRFSSPVSLKELPVSKRVMLRGPLLSIMRAGAFFLLIVALARPQTGSAFAETEERGRDIMLVLDTSGSMEALDFKIDAQSVSRLDALKTVVSSFIDKREGDRMGLIVFGSEVFTQCPLTTDHAMLKDLVSALTVGMAGDGTALGDGIAIGIRHIRDIPAESKAMVLVTDGIRTAGKLDPKEAAGVAHKLGVKIYTVGIGGNAPAPFRTKNIFGIETVTYQDVALDEKTLQAVAQASGGRYFNATNTDELAKIYNEIDRLQERSEKSYQHIEYEEEFFSFAALGFCLFLLSEVLANTALQILP